ncbi:hypothetical protein JX265_000538 [Neoarthrinium moseri]|uniref:Uncharacterized protein n=1 Tax=Neoarthrinium moseri TaxID=1658444 RepID=A0A9P9WZ15_9PEZI|nr:hypothetical protein JX265_000538 [Neoarthrinium moseri]
MSPLQSKTWLGGRKGHHLGWTRLYFPHDGMQGADQVPDDNYVCECDSEEPGYNPNACDEELYKPVQEPFVVPPPVMVPYKKQKRGAPVGRRELFDKHRNHAPSRTGAILSGSVCEAICFDVPFRSQCCKAYMTKRAKSAKRKVDDNLKEQVRSFQEGDFELAEEEIAKEYQITKDEAAFDKIVWYASGLNQWCDEDEDDDDDGYWRTYTPRIQL